MVEIWKTIAAYPNYKASSFGRIMGPSGKILKPQNGHHTRKEPKIKRWSAEF